MRGRYSDDCMRCGSCNRSQIDDTGSGTGRIHKDPSQTEPRGEFWGASDAALHNTKK